MPRVRSRTARKGRHDWPLSVEDELARGIDRAAFRFDLPRIQASVAQRRYDGGAQDGGIRQLQGARATEARLEVALR